MNGKQLKDQSKKVPAPEVSAEKGERRYLRLPAVVGHVNGVPIHAFGRIFVYGVSPDFETGVVIQAQNSRKRYKIVPKKSWEIGENGIGSMASWQPRTPQNDFQPFLAVNLIDGDSGTCWCSRGQGQADVEPAWIRIDLAREETLSEIVLVPRKDGQGIPRELTIKTSRDGWHWTTLFGWRDGTTLTDGEPLRFPFAEPTPAKQIWVLARDHSKVSPSFARSSSDVWAEHCFSLAGVQAVNEHGENVALVSRGAGVTVSSTNYGQGSSWDVYDLLWPTQYDLGVKWMRLSGSNPPYHHDTLQWRFVEQEKGKYVIDQRTDEAITEAVDNGCKVMLCLCYGNWLYTTEPENESMDIRRFPRPFPPAPVTREGFEGFTNWVRFMVKHFRGRVEYWEIWNEPWGFGWGVIEDNAERVKVYCDLLREVAPVIREEDPAAKISLAGLGIPGLLGRHGDHYNVPHPWLEECVGKYDIARLVDAIGFHCQGVFWDQNTPAYKAYPRLVREFQESAEAKGFKGVYMASENWWGAPYPPHAQWPCLQLNPLTEVRKAKDMARAFVMHLGLSVMPFWCNTWFDYGQNDGGLFRNTFSADPVSPTQPEAAYYVLRTLCTVMDGARATEAEVTFSKEVGFDSYSFALLEGGLLVGIWLPGRSTDRHPGVSTDVIIDKVRCSGVVGLDVLNGSQQELEFEQRGDQLVIPRMVIRDSPLMLKLSSVIREA